MGNKQINGRLQLNGWFFFNYCLEYFGWTYISLSPNHTHSYLIPSSFRPFSPVTVKWEIFKAFFSQRFTDVRQRVAVLTDERVKLTNQIIAGARLMKLNAWEPALEKEIRRRDRRKPIFAALIQPCLSWTNSKLFDRFHCYRVLL